MQGCLRFDWIVVGQTWVVAADLELDHVHRRRIAGVEQYRFGRLLSRRVVFLKPRNQFFRRHDSVVRRNLLTQRCAEAHGWYCTDP